MAAFNGVTDSGERRHWATGSQRDSRKGKGRFDAIPPIALRRIAQHFERGAEKYEDRNWEKGQPLSVYLDSAFRHLCDLLEGKTDDHPEEAICFNVMAFMHTKEMIERGVLPAELDDYTPAVEQYRRRSFVEVERPGSTVFAGTENRPEFAAPD